jgi:hypothetical protein
MTLVLSAFFTALVTKSRSVKRKQYTSIWDGGAGEAVEVRARVLGCRNTFCLEHYFCQTLPFPPTMSL